MQWKGTWDWNPGLLVLAALYSLSRNLHLSASPSYPLHHWALCGSGVAMFRKHFANDGVPCTQQLPYRCALSCFRTRQDIAILKFFFHTKVTDFSKKDNGKLKSLPHQVISFLCFPQAPSLPAHFVLNNSWNKYLLTTVKFQAPCWAFQIQQQTTTKDEIFVLMFEGGRDTINKTTNMPDGDEGKTFL